MSYGLGIIGCGMIADFHAKAIADVENARLVATASRSEENARRVAGPYDATAYTDYRELLARDDVDIVSICTPSGAHLEVGIDAAKAGKHIVVEKPIEVTLQRIDAFVEAAEEAGVKICGIFPSRFNESSRLLKDVVASGRFGKLCLGDAYVKWYRSQEYYDEGGWKGTIRYDGGGALMNQSIHAIDLLQWIMGPVRAVQAMTGTLTHENIEVEDTAVAAVQFASGALGTIVGTTSAYPGFSRRIEVSGNKGSVIIDDEKIRVWDFEEKTPEDEAILRRAAETDGAAAGAADPAAISHDNHARQLREFVAALDDGREPLCDGREARKAVEIVLAIYESGRRQERVELPLS